MEFLVFDLEFNLLGEISDLIEVEIERNYTKVSTLILQVPVSDNALSLLKHGNIITLQDDINYGYIIENFFYEDEQETIIEVHAYSLNWMLSWRTIPRQQRFTGNIETVIKSFIDINCINTEPNRIIPNLVLGADTGINITTESTKTGTDLLEHCFDICNAHEISIDILLNHGTKKFEVITWQGADRSVLQNENPHVIFSKEFDNIMKQNYTHSLTDYKTTAVVAGEGEGIDRIVEVVNDNVSGFDRREVYVDARDLQSTYHDENGDEKTLTPAEYKEALEKRGNEKLSEHEIIESLESVINPNSQFVYGVDFDVGDKVSIKNDDLGLIVNTRVISAKTTYDFTGEILQLDFGSDVPNIIEKIVKKVN